MTDGVSLSLQYHVGTRKSSTTLNIEDKKKVITAKEAELKELKKAVGMGETVGGGDGGGGNLEEEISEKEKGGQGEEGKGKEKEKPMEQGKEKTSERGKPKSSKKGKKKQSKEKGEQKDEEDDPLVVAVHTLKTEIAALKKNVDEMRKVEVERVRMAELEALREILKIGNPLIWGVDPGASD
ncbi:hypothetical protein HK102_009016, partial [Quaeritorhiza haematococci]